MSNNLTQFDSVDLAKHIMAVCEEKNCDYNNTKINKLLYIFYGYVLAIFKFSIANEKPHFWPYGPVFPKVYNKIDKNKLLAKKINLNNDILDKLLIDIVDSFGKFSAGKLSSWSHSEGTPWDTMNKLHLKWDTEMTDEILYDYFLKGAGGKEKIDGYIKQYQQ